MADSERTLFVPAAPLEKLNSNFKALLDAPSYHPTRAMLDHVYQDFYDPDGNFLEQFQTTAFDSRLFELYLYTYFSRSGFDVDRTHPSPDFTVARNGVTVSVEATTSNPSQGKQSGGEPLSFGLNPAEFAHFLDQELPMRFGPSVFKIAEEVLGT